MVFGEELYNQKLELGDDSHIIYTKIRPLLLAVLFDPP